MGHAGPDFAGWRAAAFDSNDTKFVNQPATARSQTVYSLGRTVASPSHTKWVATTTSKFRVGPPGAMSCPKS